MYYSITKQPTHLFMAPKSTLQSCSSTCTFQVPHGSILQQDLSLFRFWLCRKETKSHRRKKKWEHFPKRKVKGPRYTTVIPSSTSLQSYHELRKSLCSDNFIFSRLLFSPILLVEHISKTKCQEPQHLIPDPKQTKKGTDSMLVRK